MKVLFVYSGKGGVGKSTFSVNLAYSLKGVKVGLFDADFEGPSIPTMLFNLENQKMHAKGLNIIPGIYGGVYVSSVGFLEKDRNGIYLSGKYLEGALNQLLFHAGWNVDVLIIDLPPGTSEIHNLLFQQLKGKCLLITTPQAVSFSDTQRGIDLLRTKEIELLGIVENMISFKCECCGHSNEIFTGKTEEKLAQPNGLTLLESMPMLPDISKTGNCGIPIVVSNPDHPVTTQFSNLATSIFSSFDRKGSTWQVSSN